MHCNFEVHYAVRSADEIPFRERLVPLKGYIHFYDRSLGGTMDIDNILGTLSWNTHVYVCGPDRTSLAVKAAATAAGLEKSDVHYGFSKPTQQGFPSRRQSSTEKVRSCK